MKYLVLFIAFAAAAPAEPELIVAGHVLSIRSRLSRDARTIITDIDIAVDQTLKGEAPKVLTILQPGGTLGDITQVVSHQPSFTEGEKVVLNLERRPANRYRVVGGEAGKRAVNQ